MCMNQRFLINLIPFYRDHGLLYDNQSAEEATEEIIERTFAILEDCITIVETL